MTGKKVKQINNLTITKVDASLYHVYSPFSDLLYVTADLNDAILRCKMCDAYKGARARS